MVVRHLSARMVMRHAAVRVVLDHDAILTMLDVSDMMAVRMVMRMDRAALGVIPRRLLTNLFRLRTRLRPARRLVACERRGSAALMRWLVGLGRTLEAERFVGLRVAGREKILPFADMG